MKNLTIFLLVFSMIFMACETDFDVNASWKEVIVVYGLLDQSQPKQYIKINYLQIEDKSSIIPTVSNLDMPSILSTIDIFVMPSIMAESFGVSALEASAASFFACLSLRSVRPELMRPMRGTLSRWVASKPRTRQKKQRNWRNLASAAASGLWMLIPRMACISELLRGHTQNACRRMVKFARRMLQDSQMHGCGLISM